MTAEPVREIMLLLDPEPTRYGGGSHRIIARPVEWDPTTESPLNPDNDGPLDDLAAYTRVGDYNADKPAELWGWTVAYLSPFQVERYRAERMAAMLRRIARAMDTYERTYGPPPTFAAYLAVFAHAVGARRYCYRTGPRVSGTYADNAYTVTRSPARWIDDAAAELATSPASAR